LAVAAAAREVSLSPIAIHLGHAMSDTDNYPEWVDQRLSAELPVLRARGESQELEYVEKFPDQARELGKEIAAFATSNPGVILLGVSNNGDLLGLTAVETVEERDRFLRRVEGICRGPVKPAITPSLNFAVEAGKVVLAIRVPKGSQPVYYCQNIPYLRHITESRPAEPHEVIDRVVAFAQGQSSRAPGQDRRAEAQAALGKILATLLVYGHEVDERKLNPWLDELMAIFGNSAAELRQLAASQALANSRLPDELEALAEKADAVAHYQHVLGPEPWERFQSYVAEAITLATDIKQRWIDSNPLDEAIVTRAIEVVAEGSRRASNVAGRARSLIEDGRLLELQAEVGSIGREIAFVSYFGLDRLEPQLVDRLRRVGHDLHLIEAEITEMGGGFVEKLVSQITGGAEELNALANEIREWIGTHGLPTEAVDGA
jgi:hypothetical protein